MESFKVDDFVSTKIYIMGKSYSVVCKIIEFPIENSPIVEEKMVLIKPYAFKPFSCSFYTYLKNLSRLSDEEAFLKILEY